ncbi:MAG: four helix bundle protein [Thermomicrobiales bacterium]|nr:four helix bundle protein [Thermomicrobiales bacterium]
MELTKAVYSSTKSWPADERYSLTSQVRRSVVSVPANIAEGHGRSGDREFLHHLSIASGSLREVETLLEVARDAEYLQDVQFGELMVMCEQTRRPLRGLIAYLRGKQ